MANSPQDSLQFPSKDRDFLEPYLPSQERSNNLTGNANVFVTVTYASSLDSCLSLSPGVQTRLSGPQSKAMTHYLRSRHDAILIGVITAVTDDPGLNCRLETVGGYGSNRSLEMQPRPIILDPTARWKFTEDSKILQLAKEGRGRAPFVVTRSCAYDESQKALLEACGGKYITAQDPKSVNGEPDFQWDAILNILRTEGISSVMVEGGGSVINGVLRPENLHLIDAVILTIAPVWFGKGGVMVQPDQRTDHDSRQLAAATLKDVKWYPLGDDVILCGKIRA